MKIDNQLMKDMQQHGVLVANKPGTDKLFNLQIEESPKHRNIFFSALPRPDRGDDKLEPILPPLIQELKATHLDFPLTIVYGTLKVIRECFLLASNVMGHLQYEPVGTSHVAISRLFSQFHANYPEHERERIVQDLVSGKSKLRLLFVTGFRYWCRCQ